MGQITTQYDGVMRIDLLKSMVRKPKTREGEGKQ
jgi:hypothetical protein